MVSITSPGGVGSLRGMGKLGNGGCVAGLTGGSGFPGGGEKRLFRTLPETMRTRCSAADLLARLQENGGTPACEDAVIKSLRWFKGTQNTNGS